MLPRLIEELLATGLSEADIARLVESSQPTINRIRNGHIKDPKYSLAEALKRVHTERCAARSPAPAG
jgi:predicted transcriptional regulator